MNHSFMTVLGHVLFLAELVQFEQTGAQGFKRLRMKIGEPRFTAEDAEVDLEEFLSVLDEDELKDLVGLYGLGRWAFDSFAEARENSGYIDEMIPRILASRTDLHDSLINGMKLYALLSDAAHNNAEASS